MADAVSIANKFGLDHNFHGRVTIAGLPDDLALVPAGPSGPSDPDRFRKREEWEEWGERIRRYRTEKLAEVEAAPLLVKAEKWRCAQDPAYFLIMYGYLFEPRKNKGRGGYNPWILFERQVQMVRWFQWCMAQDDENADGLVSKCRDMGATWTMAGLFLHAWLFEDVFQGLFISWKQDFVDSKHQKAIFRKVDLLMQYIPYWLLPEGYTGDKNERSKLFMKNPESGNEIGGEATTGNSGRGDRVTAVLIDEGAQVPDLADVWAGLADSTEHRFTVSTESLDKGDDWVTLRSGAGSDYRPCVLTMDWYENPIHDDVWYDRQTKRYATDPDKFQREILRNPFIGSQYVYPVMREKYPLPDLEYVPGNPLYVAIDPGFDDSCAIAWIQFNVRLSRYEVLNGYTNNKQIADFYGPLLSGTMFDDEGELVHGSWTYGPDELEIIEWVASIGGRKAKFIGDVYGNNQSGASADTWYSVWHRRFGIQVNRDRLPSGKLQAHRHQARTMEGRRKALRWITPTLEFSDTVGARKVLDAVQNNQFSRTTNGRLSEHGMYRDLTTHFTSAMEYWAVNLYMQDQLLTFNKLVTERNTEMNEPVQPRGPRWASRGLAELQ